MVLKERRFLPCLPTEGRHNTINEIKNSLEGINSRITEAEEWISDLEDKIVEITTAEQNKKKKRMKRIEYSLRDFLGQH